MKLDFNYALLIGKEVWYFEPKPTPHIEKGKIERVILERWGKKDNVVILCLDNNITRLTMPYDAKRTFFSVEEANKFTGQNNLE